MTHIILVVGPLGSTSLPDARTATAKVGERLPLAVKASWAIPYVEDVTDEADLAVADPAIGAIEAGAFVGKKPGKTTVEAIWRVARDGGEHRRIPKGETLTAEPVDTFRDKIEITVGG